MTDWLNIITRPFRRGPRRPLATYRPGRRDTPEVPIGFEATDLGSIAAVNRKNDSLERVSRARMEDGTETDVRSTDVTPMPEDETYAARYYAAFQQKGS